MKVQGSCHCGYIKFEAEADPEKAGICHCTDCQTSTGSAFRTNVPVPGNGFKMLSGTPTIYVKTTAESGTLRAQAFCPKCGSPIYSTSPGDGPKESYMVRVGTLAQRSAFVPKKQNWFRSAQPWLAALAEIPKNAKQG
jgi:hypothetical protein